MTFPPDKRDRAHRRKANWITLAIVLGIIAGVALAAWLLPDGASGADYRPDSHSRIE